MQRGMEFYLTWFELLNIKAAPESEATTLDSELDRVPDWGGGLGGPEVATALPAVVLVGSRFLGSGG